jgi:hypothetical protein
LAATVNAAGLVTALAAGTTDITYTVTGNCGGSVLSFKSLAIGTASNAGTVNGAASICIGTTTNFTSTGDAGGAWSSSNIAIATINTQGVITAVTAGTANITYTVTGLCGGSQSSSKSITVAANSNAGTITGTSPLCIGSSNTYKTNGTTGGIWSSSNPAVATVNSSTASVTAISAGTAVITYTVGTCGITTATKTVTVNAAPTLSVTNISVLSPLNGCSASVVFGSNVTVTGTPTPTLVYTISGITVSSPYTFSRGTTNVSVRASNSCGNVSKTFTVTVADKQNPIVVCKGNAARTTTVTQYTIAGTEFDATATDNCGIANLGYSLSGATTASYRNANITLNTVKLNKGTTIITWRATDVGGNISTCTTSVVVSAVVARSMAIDTSANYSKLTLIKEGDDLSKPAGLLVKAMPNPTVDQFTLLLRSASKERIQILIYDVTGRVVEQIVDVTANSSIKLGRKYQKGLYFIQLFQGHEKVILRLVKSF